MARPRFHRLSAAKQDAILDAALDEFSAHGFTAASFNRIIAAAGTSKGAMYYYFDGKEDLYAEVIVRQLERLLECGGPLELPADVGPDVFWSEIEEFYLRMLRLLEDAPQTALLLRDWLTGSAPPAVQAVTRDAEERMRPWLMRLVATGQAAGAVRTDLPAELLLAAATGLGQAMDAWMITQPPGAADLAETAHVLIDMMRRALEP